jgi:hypothetical protein
MIISITNMVAGLTLRNFHHGEDRVDDRDDEYLGILERKGYLGLNLELKLEGRLNVNCCHRVNALLILLRMSFGCFDLKNLHVPGPLRSVHFPFLLSSLSRRLADLSLCVTYVKLGHCKSGLFVPQLFCATLYHALVQFLDVISCFGVDKVPRPCL